MLFKAGIVSVLLSAALVAGQDSSSSSSSSSSASSAASSTSSSTTSSTSSSTTSSSSSVSSSLTTGSSSSTSSSPGSITTHKVNVGPGLKYVFDPPSITANKDDIVIFTFQDLIHSVTQSANISFPCVSKPGGIDSGFVTVSNDSPSSPFSVTVNDTNPVWFHCAVTSPINHCQDKGMVFAINAGPNFSVFQNNAMTGSHLTGSNSTNGTNVSSSSSSAGANGLFQGDTGIMGSIAGIVIAAASYFL